MYHNFAPAILPGKHARYASATLLLFILAPVLNKNVQAEESGQFIRTTGNYSRVQDTPGINQQVRLARGVFLIAKKSITDPNFANSVLLITEYEETGTVGLILNRPLDKAAVEILPQLQELGLDSVNLYLGGPVRLNSLRLLVHSDAGLDDYYRVVDNIFQIDDLRGVENLLKQNTGQLRLRLYAGYAGWSPGQLEKELLRGDWHLHRPDTGMVFTDDPDSLWERLIEQMDMQWVEQGQKRTTKVLHILNRHINRNTYY